MLEMCTAEELSRPSSMGDRPAHYAAGGGQTWVGGGEEQRKTRREEWEQGRVSGRVSLKTRKESGLTGLCLPM